MGKCICGMHFLTRTSWSCFSLLSPRVLLYVVAICRSDRTKASNQDTNVGREHELKGCAVIRNVGGGASTPILPVGGRALETTVLRYLQAKDRLYNQTTPDICCPHHNATNRCITALEMLLRASKPIVSA